MLHVASEGGATDSLEVVLQLKCCVVTGDNFGRFDVVMSWPSVQMVKDDLGATQTDEVVIHLDHTSTYADNDINE